MKLRIALLIVVLGLLFSAPLISSFAEVDYGTVYETAIHLASNDLSNIQNLNDAVDMLEQTGSYGYSRSYLIYFQQIAAIQSADPDIDTIVLMLEVCKDITPFNEDLETRKLPSCSDLIAYANARALEKSGKLNDACAAYRTMFILDAPDRAISLALTIANATPTPTMIEASPTSTPTPKPTNTYTPTPIPTAKPTSTPVPDVKVEALPLMFSELEAAVEKTCDDALWWDLKSAPSKLSDFPLLPYGWADSIKYYKNIKYTCKLKDGKYVLTISIPDQILKNIGGLENAQVSLEIQKDAHGWTVGLKKGENNSYYIEESEIQLDGGKIIGFTIYKGQFSHKWDISFSITVQGNEYRADCWFSRKKINDQKFYIYWQLYNSGDKRCMVSMKRSKWVLVDYAPNPTIKVKHEMKQNTELYYDLNTLKIKEVKNSGAEEWKKYN